MNKESTFASNGGSKNPLVMDLQLFGNKDIGKTVPQKSIIVTEDIIREAMKDALLKTQQDGGISMPAIQRYVTRLENGEIPPPIKVDKGIIVDGNHRYVAGRVFGKEPEQSPWVGGRLKGKNMENKKIKSLDSKQSISSRWFLIVFITFIISRIIIACLAKLFVKMDYVEYYRRFAVDLAWQLGLIVLLIGLIVIKLIYLFNCKKYKAIFILIIILGCICGLSYKLIKNGDLYKYYKDLHYVKEDTYYEDLQELKNIYIKTTRGRLITTRIYIETTDFKFQVNDDIVEKKDFDKFKSKFNNVKKIKIRYLPNSEILLSIEPVSDEE